MPEGQAKASTALGFDRVQTFLRVIWPQAMIHILPAYSGQFISTVKMTSVAGYISVVDLTKASDIIRSRTYEAFFPLFFTAAVYFLLCAVIVGILRVMEKRIDPAVRPVRQDILDTVRAYGTEERELRAGQDSGSKRKKGEVLVEVRKLRKILEDVTPIKNVNCDILAGDVISVIGPSGTGKSTLLYLLNHLIEPDSGSIIFEGEDTLAKNYDVTYSHHLAV